ncbi:GSCOCG00002676001-RA-CDS, partial [Cotesia congregata]
ATCHPPTGSNRQRCGITRPPITTATVVLSAPLSTTTHVSTSSIAQAANGFGTKHTLTGCIASGSQNINTACQFHLMEQVIDKCP